MPAPTFAFVSAKGGSGTSTICSELAKSMRSERNVALVDGDLSGRRSQAIMFDALRMLDTAREDAPIAIARLNGLTLAELAPYYDSAFTLNFEDVERLAQSFDSFNTVIVDVPLPFAAPVRPFVVRATRFIVVCEPTLLGITSARTMVAELKRFGVPITRMLALVNARDTNAHASRAEIERALELKCIGELPPISDRSYAKRLGEIEKILRAIAAEPQIETLLPSTKGFVQDRRVEARGPRPASQADVETDNREQQSDPERELICERLKLDIHEALAKNVNLVEASHAHSDGGKLAELRAKIDDVAQQILRERSTGESNTNTMLTAEEIASIKEDVISEALGLGPLEDLMADEAISEIMVNGPKTVYVEKGGKIQLSGKRFTSTQQLRLVIERIIAPLGRRLYEAVPMVDARLPDGSRVNAIIEPLAIDGATVTIRRFGKRRLGVEDLLEKAALTEPMVDFLRACIEARLNILISGGTGSGKTTFLNIMASFLPAGERIVTVEDAAELCLPQPHVVRLETRPANIEGRGEISIRDLVRNSLRMRPDRIVVGECRGGEALDMLQAMNTGHDGSLTTLHANSPRDAMSRLETLVMMAGFDLPARAIREQIASAVDLVVQTSRLRDGSRKIISISEIVGMEGEVVTMQELVRYQQHGVGLDNRVQGEFQYTGVQPQALKKFEEYGISYDVRALSTMASTGSLW